MAYPPLPEPLRPAALDMLTESLYGPVPAPGPFLQEKIWEEDGLECSILTCFRGNITLLSAMPAEGLHHPCLVWLNFDGCHAVASQAGLDPQGLAWPSLPEGAVRGSGASQWALDLAREKGWAVFTAWKDEFRADSPDVPGGPAISAWASGMSLIRRAAARDPRVHPRRIFACGHSRLGKAALWAAAWDRDFAGAVSIQSGCAGAAPFRGAAGETLGQITERFPHWFQEDFGRWAGREDELPWDQHWLLALIAPRPLLVLNAAGDAWADPKGQEALCRQTAPVFPEGRLQWRTRPGGHSVTRDDWKAVFEFLESSQGVRQEAQSAQT